MIDQPDESGVPSTEVATLGAGCFWCVEALFQQIEGVISVESGYSGGSIPNPSYEQVCTGNTGHAEVCQIRFDPARLSYEQLLHIFWMAHDPTTLNRQGHDVGTQYRSVVYYHSPEQQQVAERVKRELDNSGSLTGPIVTEISPYTEFFKAEDYHQNYFNLHPQQSYCSAVIQPKMEKLQKVLQGKMKARDDGS